MITPVAKELISDCCKLLTTSTKRIDACLQLLTEDQVWQKPNESSNSIANLILHLCGNMAQHILSAMGNTPDLRERDLEFSITEGLSKKELIQKLSTTIDAVITLLEKQTDDSLLNRKSVQGFSKTGIGIVLHVTEHYSYHTGQIAFITKLIANRDLGFYKGYNLNVKNGSTE